MCDAVFCRSYRERLRPLRMIALAALALLASCATSGPPEPAQDRTMAPSRPVPLAYAAEKVGVPMQPGRDAQERVLLFPRGHRVRVRAGYSTYRFGEETRPIPLPGVRVAGGVMHVPEAIIVDLERDLRLARVTRPVAAPGEDRRGPAAASPSALAGWVIALDPGHGGKDPGTRSVSGLQEKEVNLALARLIAPKLRRLGAQVLLTREDDRFVELPRRVSLSDEAGAKLFVSLHANGHKTASPNGIEVLYPADPAHARTSRRLAESLCTALVARTQARRRGAKKDTRGLYVLEHGGAPAVIVEVGFLTNPEEGARLGEESYRERLAMGIVDGILNYAASTASR